MKSLTVLVAVSMFSLLAGPVIADPWKNESGHYYHDKKGHDKKGPPAHARGHHKGHDHRAHHHGKSHKKHHDRKGHYSEHPGYGYYDSEWRIGLDIFVPLFVEDNYRGHHHRQHHYREYRYR